MCWNKSRHECATNTLAANVRCYHVNVDQIGSWWGYYVCVCTLITQSSRTQVKIINRWRQFGWGRLSRWRREEQKVKPEWDTTQLSEQNKTPNTRQRKDQVGKHCRNKHCVTRPQITATRNNAPKCQNDHENQTGIKSFIWKNNHKLRALQQQ